MKALYVRVSTDSQVEGYSIEAQIEFLESYLKSQGWDDYEVYMDPGFSGKNLERPAIQKLIKDCESGKIDMVYLPMPKEYRAADKFDVLDGKIYWIGNVDVQSGSSICYGDFDTKGVRSKIIPGKPVASSEFSISPDGSIVYLQYLSDVDVGTYSWNPEKESVPRLLMTTLGDVHSIVNISNL